MMNLKSIEQVHQALSDRGIKFNKNENKKYLSEKLWANRDKVNIK